MTVDCVAATVDKSMESVLEKTGLYPYDVSFYLTETR